CADPAETASEPQADAGAAGEHERLRAVEVRRELEEHVEPARRAHGDADGEVDAEARGPGVGGERGELRRRIDPDALVHPHGRGDAQLPPGPAAVEVEPEAEPRPPEHVEAQERTDAEAGADEAAAAAAVEERRRQRAAEETRAEVEPA